LNRPEAKLRKTILAMADDSARPLEFGDLVPFYLGITGAGKLYSFEMQAGRTVVLLAVGPLESAVSQHVIAAFEKQAEDFTRLEADLVVLTPDDPDGAFNYIWKHASKLTISTEAATYRLRCGFDTATPAVVVMDKNRRALGVHHLAPQTDGAFDRLVGMAITDLGMLLTEAPRVIAEQPPILLLANVVSRDFCRKLIALFNKGGHFDSGFMTIDGAGKSMLKIDHDFKRRSDHFIQPGHPVHEELIEILATRIAPEIKKAFHIEVRHCERFLIACYEQSGGYFRRHRDTTGAANAHRQFAITLNLNTEDYEGGHLTFPEYGPHLYRPATGGAAIFSGALLHEALPVTKGTRYALLGLLHNTAAEQRHQAYIEGRSVESDSAV
jgi:2OG-Fe(II) oxygenase superfamily